MHFLIMLRITADKIFIFILLLTSVTAFGQNSAPSRTVEPKTGSIKFTAQVKIGENNEKLSRKRFYLIRGSRQQHAELLKQIAETNVVSRACYYADLRRRGQKISDEYVCWLKKNDCESAYCREMKNTEEALSVPEFASAYRQSLREYKQPTLALKWITTNLPDEIRNGYYEQQKTVLDKLITLAKRAGQEATKAKKGSARSGDGFQSIMTDRLGNTYFLDIDVVPPENEKTETYLITNLLPTVFGDTSYLWTCEIEIDPEKPQSSFVLRNEIGKKKCEIVINKQTKVCDLPDCGRSADGSSASSADAREKPSH